jgi:hypothetical protein
VDVLFEQLDVLASLCSNEVVGRRASVWPFPVAHAKRLLLWGDRRLNPVLRSFVAARAKYTMLEDELDLAMLRADLGVHLNRVRHALGPQHCLKDPCWAYNPDRFGDSEE